MGVSRSTVRYCLRREDESVLKEEIKEIAYEKRRFGYRRIRMLLVRKGKRVNHKKVYRLYEPISINF